MVPWKRVVDGRLDAPRVPTALLKRVEQLSVPAAEIQHLGALGRRGDGLTNLAEHLAPGPPVRGVARVTTVPSAADPPRTPFARRTVEARQLPGCRLRIAEHKATVVTTIDKAGPTAIDRTSEGQQVELVEPERAARRAAIDSL